MNTQVQNFSIATADLTANIRTIQDEHGEPWFVAKDVCGALEMKGATASNLFGLDEDEKGIEIFNTPGGNQKMCIISESGLYALIVRSTKPSAKRFRKWVTSEVLPSIRKNGMYMAPAVAKEAVESPDDFLARAVLVATEQLTRIKQEVTVLKQANEVMQPKADAFDSVFEIRKMPLQEAARMFEGVHCNRIAGVLRAMGFFYVRDGKYRVYAQYRGEDRLFTEGMADTSGNRKIFVAKKGMEKLAELYKAERLPMKKGCRVVLI